MKRVPPELDGLMWTLAEGGNDRAIDEFGERHPELRMELLRRIDMVKGLRGEKKRSTESKVAIPRFVPTDTGSVATPARAPVYWAVGLALAALAAATFAITTMLAPAPRPRPGDTPVPLVQQQPAPQPSVDVKQTPIQTPPAVVESQHPVDNGPPAADSVLKPFDMRIKQAPLKTVLALMSEKSGLQIQAAPGMPNPLVDIDYTGWDAMQILQDLGQRYAFTPEDQHDGSIWLIPAVDPSAPVSSNPAPSIPRSNLGIKAVPSSGGSRDRKLGE